ncbi:MAG TPA: phosphonate ABC transporter, permease protein PhnE [Stellaceae bacterium]|nr:phosphonate ABC transporter, permease protein PhnE [Stellaceae bacterium]
MTLRVSDITPEDIAAERRRMPRAFAGTLNERAMRAALWLLFLGFVIECLWQFDVTPQRLFLGIGGVWKILRLMVPPQTGGFLPELLGSLAQTLAMAFIGTLLATLFAVPLGFLAARNVLPNWVLHFGLRRGLDVLRGIDQLIWALVFVRAVGLGPLTGILAIAISDTGTLAKLFSEAIENVDRKPVDGVRSVGALPFQVLRYGVVPQVIPVILSQALYFFESNTRSATILGIVGAGGIGLALSERIKANLWDQVAFVILIILVTVAVIDMLSRLIRHRLIRGAPSTDRSV